MSCVRLAPIPGCKRTGVWVHVSLRWAHTRSNRTIAPLRVVVFGCVSAVSLPSGGFAQQPLEDRLSQQAAVLAANTAAGALTAGVRALLEGHDFSRAFARGALGGALGYTGKRIAVERFTAAPVLGRTIGAVGNSVIMNATGSGGLLDSVAVPVGPLLLGFARERGFRPRVVVVVWDVVLTVAALAESDLHMDWRRTLSVGAPVFRTRHSHVRSHGRLVNGLTAGRLIILDGTQQPAQQRDTFSHEVIHVLQHDFFYTTWDRPVEAWLRRSLPGGSIVPAWLEFEPLTPLINELLDALNNGNGILGRLSETEAEWFERR
jgi:hypothetical protein